MAAGFVGQIMGEFFDKIAAAPWVDDIASGAFFLQEYLGIAGDAGREIGRQGQSFI